ncbi:nitrogen fixation/metabolism regulation signal transduction histidine kinase [Spirosoma lacussanchae]|uniref:sensor histidine kinase n=1 Tax=Spirosoma lacussanchae TaxID=1884249 RepID=UPI001108D756|nr:ATP-binding protein [Spirosoma lacussanchae]
MHLNFQTRYLLYMLAVHAVLVGLVFQLLKEHKFLFIASEVFILLSLYVAIRLYRTFRQPSAFIASGIEAIREKDFTIKFVPTGNEEVDELIRVYNLMIDQLRHERTRQAEQQFFLNKLIDASPIALLIFDFDERVSALNPKARQLLKLSDHDLLAKPLSATGHPLLTQLSALPPDQPHTIKLAGVETYRAMRGKFIDRGFERQFLFIEELTAEIVETEKKAYGKVIRMMAHEVNNSIGAVNSILTIAEPELPDADIRQAVRVAIERNDRLNLFMRRFADVVRLPVPSPVRSDVTELVQNVVRLMQPQAQKRGVNLSAVAPDTPVYAPIDVGQLEQVLVNVIKNALEACQPGQVVELRLTDQQVQVRNNGQPISASVAADLFNPFFSTKADGQGIGLTLTREILLNHGFPFSLRTNPDGWTVFQIGWNRPLLSGLEEA